MRHLVEVMNDVQNFVDRINAEGFTITIETSPLYPLAMGNHANKITVRAPKDSNPRPASLEIISHKVKS